MCSAFRKVSARLDLTVLTAFCFPPPMLFDCISESLLPDPVKHRDAPMSLEGSPATMHCTRSMVVATPAKLGGHNCSGIADRAKREVPPDFSTDLSSQQRT